MAHEKSAMSDYSDCWSDQREVVIRQGLQVAGILVGLIGDYLIDHFARDNDSEDEDWVQELLSGHPECIRNELGVHRSTFIVLLKAIQTLGLQSSHHVPIEEQLSIFLYTVVTGKSFADVGERFQRSSSTINKSVLTTFFNRL